MSEPQDLGSIRVVDRMPGRLSLPSCPLQVAQSTVSGGFGKGRRGDTADTEGAPWGKGPRGEAAACRSRAQSHSRSSSASPGSAAAGESRTVTWQRPRGHVGQVTAVTCGRHCTMCPPVPPAHPVPGSAQEHGNSPGGSPARGRARGRAPSSGHRLRSRRRRWGGNGAGARCPYMGRAAGPRAAAEVTVTSERREPSAGAGRGAPAGSGLKGGAQGGGGGWTPPAAGECGAAPSPLP